MQRRLLRSSLFSLRDLRSAVHLSPHLHINIQRRLQDRRCLACAICGVLCISLPIPIIVNNFNKFYEKAKIEEEILAKKKKSSWEEAKRGQFNSILGLKGLCHEITIFWWPIKLNQYFLYMRWWFFKFCLSLLLRKSNAKILLAFLKKLTNF